MSNNRKNNLVNVDNIISLDNTKSKPENTVDKTQAMREKMQAYTTAYTRDPYSTTTATALTELASMVAYSVVRKCIDASASDLLRKYRAEIAKARHDLLSLDYCRKEAYAVKYTDDGEIKDTVNDPDARDALTKLSRDTIGDGYELVHDAITAIETAMEDQHKRDPKMPYDLERPYTITRMKTKVRIKSAENSKGYETTETMPIKEVFRAVRRSIADRRAPKIAVNGYSYLAGTETDSDGNTQDIYIRAPKYADIGGDVTTRTYTDAGTPDGLTYSDAGTYTADEQIYDGMQSLIAKLNLSAREMQVLELRLRGLSVGGYGKKAIANYLGISESNVYKCIKRIQDKARKAGFQEIDVG